MGQIKDRLQELIDHIEKEIDLTKIRVYNLEVYKKRLLQLQEEEQNEKNKDSKI